MNKSFNKDSKLDLADRGATPSGLKSLFAIYFLALESVGHVSVRW